MSPSKLKALLDFLALLISQKKAKVDRIDITASIQPVVEAPNQAHANESPAVAVA